MYLKIKIFHELMERHLHRRRLRDLRAGLAFAVIFVDRLILGQNAGQNETMLVNLLADRVVEDAAGGAIDDKLHGVGLQLQLVHHLGDAGHSLDAPAGAVAPRCR